MIWSVLFLVAAGCMLVVAIFGMFTLTYIYSLSGGRGVAGDGLRRGTVAPTWTLTDANGTLVSSPPISTPLQLIVFSDHSLKSFPSVVEGLRQLAALDPQLEIVVLTRGHSALAKPVLTLLGLGQIPLLTGSSPLYARYNVRVLPFIIFVDDSGKARASSLVNEAWQLERLWKLAKVRLNLDDARSVGRFRGRLATGTRS